MRDPVAGRALFLASYPSAYLGHRSTLLGLLLACAASVHAGSDDTTSKPVSTDQAKGLATVTVNARRRDEDVQRVPTAITVVDGQALEQAHVQHIQDLQQYLPSTNVIFLNPRQSSISVRGIGANPANDGLEGSVGVYLDDVYLARPGMAVLDLLDISQIELLRGPQGTLFGKNSTAGVLDIQSNRPSFDHEASIEQSFGSRGYFQTKLTAAGALSAHWAGRITAYKSLDGGFISNPDQASNKQLGRGHREGVRGQLLYQPSPSFDLRLIADYNREDSATGGLLLYNPGPTINGYNRYLGRAAAVGATDISRNPYANRLALDQAQNMTVEQGGLSAEAVWHLPHEYSLTSVTAVRFWNFIPSNDDGLNANAITNSGVRVHDRQYSQELRLASPSGQTVEWVAGLYYFQQQIKSRQVVNYGPLADIWLGTPTGALARVNSEAFAQPVTHSAALFAQSIWHFAPQWSLTFGLRGTDEQKHASITAERKDGAWLAPGPALTARNRQAPIYDTGLLRVHGVSPTGLLSLNDQINDQLMAYFSLSHGEKSGGINTTLPTASNLASAKVGAERANALELGLKGGWFDQRLQADLDAFWSQINGYQATSFDPISQATYLTNAGNVRTRGLEWDLRARPIHDLQVSFNGAYNDASYLSFARAGCPSSISLQPNPPPFCNLSGRPVTGASHWNFNLGAEYRHSFGAGWQHYVNLNYAWRSAFFGTLDDSPQGRVGAYGLLNLATGVRIPLGQQALNISLWLRNLLNKGYYTAIWNGSNGAYTGNPGIPRTVGVTIGYEF